MTDIVIDVNRLSKAYGSVLAVDEVSFRVQRGAVCGLLGTNGAGKTTTIAMLLGLIVPTSGQITVFGEDILRDRYRVLGRMNFSSPYVDLPQRLTVEENLTVYARLYGVRNVDKRLRQLGVDLEVASFIKRPFRTLSAGQKTRVGLAKALINEPELLLLDEPTASLDPDTADRVRSFLSSYQASSGTTLLLASHNMTEVERICTDVMIMRAGRIVDQGTPQGLIARYGRGTMEEVFLDVMRETNDRETDRRRAALS
ncbi:MAG: ABC transporter ATP-binding protein [Gammaproteobacteria bacterium]|nr:ABC transporter ATP-binding protein [Gammaproteobacteria bacterium]